MNDNINTIAIIVAHPDDETLWAGERSFKIQKKNILLPVYAEKKMRTGHQNSKGF